MILRALLFSFALLFNLALGAQNPCLVLRYGLDAHSYDGSGNGYHAVNNGAQATFDRFGRAGSAFLFDGNNDFLETNQSFDFQNRSISLWVRMSPGISGPQSIFAQDANTLQYGAMSVGLQNGEIRGRAGGNGSLTIASNYNSQQWYHLVLVRTADSVFYYLDGLRVNEGSANNGGSGSQPNANLCFGTDRTRNRNFFAGELDDIRLYNCALDATEIQQINREAPQCLVADYRFSGNLADSSGLGFDLRRAQPNRGNFGPDRFNRNNRAFALNGGGNSSAYLETGRSFDYPERTVVIWFAANQVQQEMSLFSQDDQQNLLYGAMNATVTQGQLSARAGGNGTKSFGSLQAGRWYQLALVRTLDSVKYYLNGQLMARGTSNSGGSSAQANDRCVLGAHRSRSRGYWEGSIDDLLVYRCALGPQQIDSLFANYGLAQAEYHPRQEKLQWYPNPTRGAVELTWPIDWQGKMVRWQVSNSSGQIWRSGQREAGGAWVLNLEALPEGIYHFRASSSSGESRTARLMRQ